MTRLALPICLILILLGTLGCEPPTGKSAAPSDPPPTTIEVLGIAGPLSKLSSWSYAFASLTVRQSDIQFEADLAANQIAFTRGCGRSTPTETSIALPSAISASVQNLFSTEELCQLTYELPPDTPVCMAMMVPLAYAELANGETIPLSRAGASICYQSITYFCDAKAQADFIEQLEALLALAPECQ